VSNEQIQKIRGLNGVYSFGGVKRANEPVAFSKDDAANVPYNVAWSGQFLCPYFGKFRFYNDGDAPMRVSIDGHATAADKEVQLAEGFHRIAVSASRSSAGQKLNLKAAAKMLVNGNNIQKVEVIDLDKKYLYNINSFGLHGYYYRGEAWEENPLQSEIIASDMCFAGGAILTESAVWRGNIKLEKSDAYSIFARTNGYCRIVIDGRYYWEQLGNPETNDKAKAYFARKNLHMSNNTSMPSMQLTAGKHSVAIYTLDASILQLMWKHGGITDPQPVPMDSLEPDYQLSSN
jgi:hypothetical protein